MYFSINMIRRACFTFSARGLPVQILDRAASYNKHRFQFRTLSDASVTEITFNRDDTPKQTKTSPPPRQNEIATYNSKQRRMSGRKNRHRKKKSELNRQPPENDNLLGTSTEWVSVTNIPPLSTLEDLLVDVERIMTTEAKVGIVDLDAAEHILQQNMESSTLSLSGEIEPLQKVPIWEPDESLPGHMVLEAHLILSTLTRPKGWHLRFPNRSCVHALISHTSEARINGIEGRLQVESLRMEQAQNAKKHHNNLGETSDLEDIPDFSYKMIDTRPLMCAWKEVDVYPFFPERKDIMRHDDPFFNEYKWRIDDTVVRVENCCRHATPYEIELLFSRYDLLDERCSDLEVVEQIVFAKSAEESYQRRMDDSYTPSATTAFLIRFSSAAEARAAVREKQNIEFMGRKLMLAQFPRQILHGRHKK